ncbi:MAG: hypothetical protein QM690_09805 [Sphingobium sp.]
MMRADAPLALLAGLGLLLASPCPSAGATVIMAPLCGAGGSVPVPIRRDGDPADRHDLQCRMPCHAPDRRRRPGCA